MTRLSPRTLFIVMIAVIASALVVKTVRYTSPRQGAAQTFDTNLTMLLTRYGWQRENHDAEKQKRSIDLRTFRKQGCPNPIRISVLGTTTGLESYLRQRFGDNLAFVQQGQVRAHPSQLRLQVAITVGAIKNLFAQTSWQIAPIFAVIPAPRDTPKSCQGPTRADWSQLNELTPS